MSTQMSTPVTRSTRPSSHCPYSTAKILVGVALGMLSALLWSHQGTPLVHALAITASVCTGMWWAFGLRRAHRPVER